MDDKDIYSGAAVVIPAAGSSVRMEAGRNKQFLKVSGVPILARTISIFKEMPEIDRIIVVLNPDEFDVFRDEIAVPYGLTDIEVVAGGADRQSSVYEGLRALDDMPDDAVLLVHDGARPLVTPAVILDNIHGACEFGAAVTAVPVSNTIKITNSKGFSVQTPERDTLYEAQTPQGFRIGVFRRAAEQAQKTGFTGTDDVSLVERMGLPVRITKGSRRNLKITVPEDMIIAEALFAQPDPKC